MLIDFYIRALDIILALIALFLTSPILIITSLIIRLDNSPTIFKQKRNGRTGSVFTIYKFRTMRVMENGDSEFQQATNNDDRYTAFGKFLRHYSIDELPQLVNVLKGDMSLVGPRPHALAHDRQFIDRISNYMNRYDVKPGITGLAQIRGFRGETDTLEKMQNRVTADKEYIEKRSVRLYMRILRKTINGRFHE